MLNKKVLVSGADFFALDAPINPYYDDRPADVTQAMADHNEIINSFKEAGIEIKKVDPPHTSQDGVYTANWALVKGKKAILSRLPNARKTEEIYAKSILEEFGIEVIEVPEDWHFSGQGDALACGQYLLAGQGYRSDPRAQIFAAETLGYDLIQLKTKPQLDNKNQPIINASSGWPDSFFYDIDLALSVLRKDLIAYCPEAFDEESNVKINNLPVNKIKVSYAEATKGFACNLVSTGETVIMSNHAPELRAAIESHGMHVMTPDVKELPRGGGYIRCVSLALD